MGWRLLAEACVHGSRIKTGMTPTVPPVADPYSFVELVQWGLRRLALTPSILLTSPPR